MSGFRVHWTHRNGRDRFIGEFWDQRSDAEYIADLLRASGWCFDVEIRRWSS